MHLSVPLYLLIYLSIYLPTYHRYVCIYTLVMYIRIDMWLFRWSHNCIYIYIHTYMYTYTYTYISICIRLLLVFIIHMHIPECRSFNGSREARCSSPEGKDLLAGGPYPRGTGEGAGCRCNASKFGDQGSETFPKAQSM